MVNVAELEKICKEIMDLDPKMRSARIINNRGHLVAGGMKGSLQSLEEQKHDETARAGALRRLRGGPVERRRNDRGAGLTPRATPRRSERRREGDGARWPCKAAGLAALSRSTPS